MKFMKLAAAAASTIAIVGASAAVAQTTTLRI